MAGTVVRGGGQPLRRADLRGQADRARRDGWELYHVDEDFAENHNLAADNRDRLIAMIGTLVRRGRQVRRAADRRQRPRAHAREKPLVAAPRDRYVYFPDTQSVPFFAAPRVAQPPAQHHRRGRDPRGRRRGRAALPGHARRRLHVLRQGRQLRYAHNYVGRRLLRVASDERGARRARTSCASSSSRPASWTSSQGKGAPGRVQLYIDGSWSARPTCRTRRRSSTRGAHLRREPGLADRPRLRGAVPVHRHAAHVTVDVSGELIIDAEAEMRVHMARQ